MSDQASILRGIAERQPETARVGALPHRRARSVVLASGKGGVGKSVLALNLAVTMAQQGHAVCLLDACLGLGNIDLLCGLNGYWNLSHVITGSRGLSDVLLDGPGGIHIVPGASGLTDLTECPESVQHQLLFQLEDLERTHQFLIIDTSSGVHRFVRPFITAADQILVVTTPETTALADAYSTIKALAPLDSPPIDLVVNRVETAPQGKAISARLQQTTRNFLRTSIGHAGSITHDPAVTHSVASRKPFVLESPGCAASGDMQQFARRVVSTGGATQSFETYFDRFLHRQKLRAA